MSEHGAMSLTTMTEVGVALLDIVGPLTLATGALLLAALAVDRLLEDKIAAGARVLLYLGVFARLGLPGDWQSPLGLLQTSTGAARAARIGEGEISINAPGATAASSAGDLAPWIALVWVTVAAALIVRWALARYRLARALRSATPLAGAPLPAGVRAPVLQHETIGPLVAGVLRPRIVIPEPLAQGTDRDTLAWVLRHEAAHVARRDPWLGAVLQLVCFVAWPILPVWIAARRMRTLIELACDERALSGADGRARRQYGEVLLAVAGLMDPTAPPAPGMSFRSPLKARLRALGGRRRWPRVVQVGLAAAVVAGTLACSGTGAPDEAPTPPAPGRVAKVAADEGAKGAAGANGPRRPDIVPGQASVEGGLDKEIVRRIVRRHINEVKYCYESTLAEVPALGGRVQVQFTVGANGSVLASVLQDSTMGSPPVENCIVKAVRRWEFPKPLGGGTVIVTYPFNFIPGSPAP